MWIDEWTWWKSGLFNVGSITPSWGALGVLSKGMEGYLQSLQSFFSMELLSILLGELCVEQIDSGIALTFLLRCTYITSYTYGWGDIFFRSHFPILRYSFILGSFIRELVETICTKIGTQTANVLVRCRIFQK